MKASTIQWHLARDNQLQLARFCEKNKVSSHAMPNTAHDEKHYYWQLKSVFDNGGYIVAELMQGDERSFNVADHYQVVDYSLGAA